MQGVYCSHFLVFISFVQQIYEKETRNKIIENKKSSSANSTGGDNADVVEPFQGSVGVVDSTPRVMKRRFACFITRGYYYSTPSGLGCR